MKRSIVLAAAGAAIVIQLFIVPRNVSAVDKNVCFCHNILHNPITICTDNSGLINGHMGHVEKGDDTLGECAPQPTVPEFSLVTGGFAALSSAFSFLVWKRKVV